jgi:hypothetical protein
MGAFAQTAPQLLPYTMKVVAGGGTSNPAKGGTCPVSGYIATDAYGDGCLATEILLGTSATAPGPRSAVADSAGNVFFTDYVNGLVRRVDAITGIVSVVAGGATASPASGTACGSGTSTDAIGDGCPGTSVKLSHPASILLSPSGDLYFGDVGQGQVRKIAATNGSITTTGTISLIAGNVGGTYGYAANNATTTIVAATQSYLRAPYGLAFDNKGDLFIVDEYTEAILVVNTNTTGSNTVNNVTIPAGTIAKIAGTSTGSTAPYCVNGTASGYGCNYGLYTENAVANATTFDSTYSVAVDSNGTVYGGNEYYDSVFKVTSAGILSTFAGIQNNVGTKPTIGKRGQAGSFGVGSIFGVAVDANNNVYFTDASSGAIWRVDYPSLTQYVVATGLGSSGSGNYATTTLPGPGVYGVSVDAYSDLFGGDTEKNVVYEIASGTQFGPVGANQPTQTVEIHFANADLPASASPYVLTAGSANFALGKATCNATNSDGTTDCLLPITATPTVLGPFTGTLQVTSAKGLVSNFLLSGTFMQSPVTLTSLSYAAGVTCAGSTIYATTTPITLTATITANGPTPPTATADTVTFYANGTQIGSPVQVVNSAKSGSSAVYTATLPYTFLTPGTYTVTAVFSGDSYYKTSTGKAGSTITTSAPAFSLTPVSYQQGTVTAGQTALYSFNVALNVYTGTIGFAVTGLPANSSAVLTPTTITGAGCSSTSTVALSILTQKQTVITPGGFGTTGHGRWQLFSIALGLGLALLVGLRRRSLPLRSGQLMMALALLLTAAGATGCGKAVGTVLQPATPSGTYTITVTPTATASTAAPITFTLIVQ